VSDRTAGSEVARRSALLRPTVLGILTILGALVVSGLFATWPSLTVGSSALVIGVGGGVSFVTLRRPTVGVSAQVRARRWLPWLLLGLALALWELALLLLGNNDSWPPLSMLAGPIDTLGAGRFSLALAWLAGGAWLAHRCRR
jgi:hypothetical protein